jgi:hypothetical protein
MWKFQFCEADVKRVMGERWNLGSVRVSWSVSLSMDGSFDFVEHILNLHLHLAAGELNSEAYELEAIVAAKKNKQTYCTRYIRNGVVYIVTTNPATNMTEVTQAYEDEIERWPFETNFQSLLLEGAHNAC